MNQPPRHDPPPKSYVDMDLAELYVVRANITDEILEVESELQARRYRDSAVRAGLKPIGDFRVWRAQQTSRLTDLRRDIVLIKSLINEKRADREEKIGPEKAKYWRRRAHYLRMTLMQVRDVPALPAPALALVQDALANTAAEDLKGDERYEVPVEA